MAAYKISSVDIVHLFQKMKWGEHIQTHEHNTVIS